MLAVAPYLYLVLTCELGFRDFATKSRRGFLASAVPRTLWAKNIVEACDARLKSKVFSVVGAVAPQGSVVTYTTA